MNKLLIRKIALITTQISIGIVLIVSVMVMFGWITNNSSIIQIHHSFAPMQFNTAFCFLLCGIVSFMLCRSKSILIIRGLIVFLGIISFATLLQYLLNINFGLDELIVDSNILVRTSHNGRMSPMTSFGFILFAVASFLLTFKTNISHTSGFLGLFIMGIGVFAFVGYLTNIQDLIRWANTTDMAIHTSTTFILIGGALVLLNFLKKDEFNVLNLSETPYWIYGYMITVIVSLLMLELRVPNEFNIGVFYGFVVPLAWLSRSRKGIFYFALVAAIFSLLGLLIHKDYSIVFIINRIISVVLIFSTAIAFYFLKKQQVNLKRKNKILDESINKNIELKQFAYSVSHGFKEPVRTIISFIELLQKNGECTKNEMDSEYVGVIKDASIRLQGTMDGLLELMKIGNSERKVVVDSKKLIECVITDLQLLIHEKNVAVELGELPSLAVFELEFSLLIQNLIINAVKFSRKNSDVKICIDAKQFDEDHWQFCVQDNGIGILEKDFDRIFGIFTKLDGSDTIEGAGVGLAQCKRVVEQHGGKIWVESDGKSGSSFYFTLLS